MPKMDVPLPPSKDHNYQKKSCSSNPPVSNHDNNACDNQNVDNPDAENIVYFVNTAEDGELFADTVIQTDVDETANNYLEEIEKKIKEIEELKIKLARLQPQVDGVAKIFNEDQLYKLLHPKTTAKWSSVTVEQCLQLYLRVGTTGYEFLLKKGYPLVSISVLQKYLRKLNSDPGIQYDIIKVLKKKVDVMPKKSRYCALVVDEFELQAKKEYDCSTGTIIGTPTIPPSDRTLANRAKLFNFNPDNLMAQKCFNGCIGGLTDRWSQLVYWGFTERSFSKQVVAKDMKELIGLLQYINLDVCAFTMDMGLLGIQDEFDVVVAGSPECPAIFNLAYINGKPITVSGDPVHLMKAQSTYLLNTKKEGTFDEEPEVEVEDNFTLPVHGHNWYYEEDPHPEFDFNEVANEPEAIHDPEVPVDPVVSDDPAPETKKKIFERVLYMDPEYVKHYNLVTDKISVEPIERLVEFQEKHESPLVKRLSSKLLDKARDHFGKMDASVHLAIFHKDTATAITFMVENFDWPKEYLTTAQHIYLVAHWFEIVSERGLEYAFSKAHPEQRQQMIEFLEFFPEYICKVRYYHNQKKIRTIQKGTAAACFSALWLQDYLLKDPDVNFFAVARGILTDIIENHHFRVREKNKSPTPLQCTRIQKALMAAQLLTSVGKGHNYLQDDRTRTMFDHDTLNQVLKEEEAESKEAEADIQEFDDYCLKSGFDPRNFESPDQFTQRNSLTNYIGYCMSKKLKGKTCECKKFYREQKEAEGEDPLNKLLDTKKIFSTHDFWRPSYKGNTIFHFAEKLFKDNRAKNLHVKKMDVMLKNFINAKLKVQFPEIPPCQHFDSILQLFIKGRLCYYGKHLDKFGHEEHKVDITQGAAHASKSTASLVVLR